MSRAVRRLQRRGHPVVEEQLEYAVAHYRNATGAAFEVRLDSKTADMLKLCQQLEDIVIEEVDSIDMVEAIEYLDALAAESYRTKKRMPLERAVTALLYTYWLEHHGHLTTDDHNGILFGFSRLHSGDRVMFLRNTLDPTAAQEAAFARNINGMKATGIRFLKVTEDEAPASGAGPGGSS